MKRIKEYLIVATVALALAGCDVKDPIYNTPHPDKGIIAGTADWTERGEGVAVPAEYRVEAAASVVVANSVGSKFILPHFFEPGSTEVLAYNVPEGLSVNAGIATVNRTDGGTAGTLLIPTPGILFSGTATTVVVADDTVQVTVPMHQRMRQLRFELTVTDGDSERITAIEARLEGMAAATNLRTGEVTGDAVAVRIPFVRTADKLTADAWVVGVIPQATRQLVVVLTFTDQHQSTTTSDVSDALRDFNAEMLPPFTLRGTLYAPVGASPDGMIINWTPGNGNGEDIDANM